MYYLIVLLLPLAYGCDCPYSMQNNLQGDKIYDYCSVPNIIHVKLSKVPGSTCTGELSPVGRTCPMNMEIKEDFFAKEPGHAPLPKVLVGGGSIYACNSALPKPGEYIMTVFNNGDGVKETYCTGFRVEYNAAKAKEIRETVKKCPKERNSFDYWEKKGTEKMTARG